MCVYEWSQCIMNAPITHYRGGLHRKCQRFSQLSPTHVGTACLNHLVPLGNTCFLFYVFHCRLLVAAVYFMEEHWGHVEIRDVFLQCSLSTKTYLLVAKINSYCKDSRVSGGWKSLMTLNQSNASYMHMTDNISFKNIYLKRFGRKRHLSTVR